jgi:hypothetical protein
LFVEWKQAQDEYVVLRQLGLVVEVVFLVPNESIE